MQHNYGFHLHHQLVDASQILGELSRSFYCNRNVEDGSWYWKPHFLFDPHLIWCIDSQISGKEFLIVLKNINGEKKKFLIFYPQSRKTSGLMSSKVDIVKLLQCIITSYINLLNLSCPLQYAKRLVT